MTPIQQLYRYFSDLMKPTGAQFRALIDSFWHKAEKIPISSIEGLDKLIEGTASDRQLQNHINDTNAHKEVLDKKVDKVAGKILSSNDFTNELRQKLEGLQQVDTSGLLPKGGYTGTAQDLKNLIDAINRILQSDDTDLDQLQEIVTYIKQNKHILSTLGISNIAGLVEALAAKAEKEHHHDERYAPITHHHNEYSLRTHRHNLDDIDGLPNNLATTENVKTAIEGIQIGGRNYFAESSYLKTNLFYCGVGITAIDKNNEKISEIHTVKPNENWVRVYKEPMYLDFLEGKEVTISFDVKVLEGDLGCPTFYAGSFTAYMELSPVIGNIEAGKWVRVYKTFTSRTGWEIHLGFSRLSGKYQLRNFKLELGNKPTDWTPAPEDFITPEEVMRKITRTGYEVSTDTVIPQAQQNDTIFVKASCTLGLQNIEHLGSVSFIKTFDNGIVTFTCAGKNIIYPFDNTFNGKKGSTAVVSIHNNDCYIRISNV
nr:MAG TPA: Minor structural protein 4 [Caudoviricetes sp.]